MEVSVSMLKSLLLYSESQEEEKTLYQYVKDGPPYSRSLITGFILSYSSNGLQGCYPLHRMFLVVTIHHIGDYCYYLARLGAGRRICTIIFCMGYRRIALCYFRIFFFAGIVGLEPTTY